MSSFRLKWICNECDTEFDILYTKCPTCLFVEKMEKLINKMKIKGDYLNIKKLMIDMEDGMPKFDLYNKTNTKRKELNL